MLKIIVQEKGSYMEWFPSMAHVNVQASYIHTMFHSQKCQKEKKKMSTRREGEETRQYAVLKRDPMTFIQFQA